MSRWPAQFLFPDRCLVWLAWWPACAVAVALEWYRLRLNLSSGAGVVGWLAFWDVETTLPSVVLLAWPVVFLVRRRTVSVDAVSSRPSRVRWDPAAWQLFIFSVVLAGVSLFCSWCVGMFPVEVRQGMSSQTVAFKDLPPAYHDEYSYLLQAETFLAGRLSWPPAPVQADLFHQFHVINEGRTVSRYFPLTGLWIAPWLKIHQPVLGHWVAGAFATALFFVAMTRVAPIPEALAGGLLIAVSPGLAVFSNLLLAHHPTMLMLALFTVSYFQLVRTDRLRWALLASVGLSLAMLGRPMTAFGFGLPFGVHFLLQLVRRRLRYRHVAGFVIPLMCAFGFLAVLNVSATGSWFQTAYQQYTDRYTPRHRFGFGNGEVPAEGHGPDAVQRYDKWATNLTAPRAAQNVWRRLKGAFIWSLGILPMLFLLLMCGVARWTATDDDQQKAALFRLLPLSVVSLHVVHIPYWFDGIMHWHYVFETAPVLLLLAGYGCVRAVRESAPLIGRRTATGWVAALLLSALIPAWFQLDVFHGTSKVSAAVSELSWSRVRLYLFRQTLKSDAVRKPALVLVDERDSDPQLSYIINPPDLNADVLVCRLPEHVGAVDELKSAFPDRTLYVFDPRTMKFSLLDESTFDSGASQP